MDIIQFLNSDVALLPKQRPAHQDFPDFLQEIFNAFISGLASITGSDQLTTKVLSQIMFIQDLSHTIEQMVRKYYSGLPHESFQLLSDWIKQYSTQFDALYTIPIDPEYLCFYRIRTQDAGDFTRYQMFHIPFELRHKVTTQRYSIHGYPCLYAGSSLFICWKELGCPPFDNIYSVRLEGQKNIRVLDFGYTPRNLADVVKLQIRSGTNNQRFLSVLLPKILFWPLIAACSVQVLYPDSSFKPEYIVPQLLLQYVKEDKTKEIDGIRFFSIYYDQPKDSLRLGCNFVFPVKTQDSSGQCQYLKTLFKMTEVLSWQVAKHIQMSECSGGASSEIIELVKGNKCAYINTIFGEMEAKGLGMPAAAL